MISPILQMRNPVLTDEKRLARELRGCKGGIIAHMPPHESARNQDDSEEFGVEGGGERSSWWEGRGGTADRWPSCRARWRWGRGRSACPGLCTDARASACGCGHAPGEGEAGAKHKGQELTSHLPDSGS